jgi:hypothetical protein
MNEIRELRDDELSAVAGGATCAAGRHFSEASLSSGSPPPSLNPWQEWMRDYFGVVPR